MKNKTLLIISLIVVAFLIGTSYTPQVAMADTKDGKEEITDQVEVIDYEKDEVVFEAEVESDSDEAASANSDNDKLNSDNELQYPKYGFISSVGITMTPQDSRLDFYNGAVGCIGSNYDGPARKSFVFPINAPYGVTTEDLYVTYFNNVEAPDQPIRFFVYRRKYNTLETEQLKAFRLEQTGSGMKYFNFGLSLVLDTSNWYYWVEVFLPQGSNIREFCGFQIDYRNPSIFPVAIPLVRNK